MRRQSKLYLLAFSFVVLALFILMPESTNVIPKARAGRVDDHDQNSTLQSMRGTYAVVGHGTIFAQLPGFPQPPEDVSGAVKQRPWDAEGRTL